MAKIAIVTGANQGLGLALVRGLADRLGAEDTIYLTARNKERGLSALADLGDFTTTIRFERLDVTDEKSIVAFAHTMKERHGGIDIVASNAAARIAKDQLQSEQVRDFVETNNHGSYRLFQKLEPLLNANARYIMVASSFGTLSNLPEQLHDGFDTDKLSLEDIEATMDGYVEAMENGTASEQGWPEWINVPSKIGQVATARIAARLIKEARPNDGILINAACPGLIDTDASRPWFDDMSQAQSPDEAARALVDLLLAPVGTTSPNGELARFGGVVSWKA